MTGQGRRGRATSDNGWETPTVAIGIKPPCRMPCPPEAPIYADGAHDGTPESGGARWPSPMKCYNRSYLLPGGMALKPARKTRLMGRHIVTDPRVCHGKPTFRGTRVLVSDVLEQVGN